MYSPCVLTKKQLDHIWTDNGLYYRMRRFHKWLRERGLLPFVGEDKFTTHMYSVLEAFFVQGKKEGE